MRLPDVEIRRWRVVILTLATVGFAVACVGSAPAFASGWSTEPIPAPGGFLDGVSCASASVCTAGGDYGGYDLYPLADRWNGTKWLNEPTPNPAGGFDSFLLGMSCASASVCTAVGDYNNGDATLAERWNGSKWRIQRTPQLPGSVVGAETNFLLGVSCTSTNSCTAVGHYYDTISGPEQLRGTVTLAEHWNGTTWSIQQTPNPAGATDSELYGVSCVSASACTAVGDYFSPTTGWVTLGERWNGTTWSIEPTPNPTSGGPQTQPILNGVSCASARVCTAVGNYFNGAGYATLAERWNGSTWSIQQTPNANGDSYLNAVSCAKASVCTAVGYYWSGTNLTLAERWNGTTWKIQTTPNSGILQGVSCASTRTCTAVGGGAERWNRG